METCWIFLIICVFVIYINGIECGILVNSSSVINVLKKEVESKSRTLGSLLGGPYPDYGSVNVIPSKYEPSDFDDYPPNYYKDQPIYYNDQPQFALKPGLGFGGSFGFYPGLAALGLLISKFKLTSGFWTAVKVILKFILFKKLIKFFIILFIFIFTPSIFSIFLRPGFSYPNQWLYRKYNYEISQNEQINGLATFVLTAIDSYKNAKDCKERKEEEYQCRLNNMFDTMDRRYPFQKVMTLYRKELDAVDEPKDSPT